MKIDASLFGDIRIQAVRRALRRLSQSEWTNESLAHEARLGEAGATALRRKLQRHGFIERVHGRPGHWQTTLKGDALANARLRRVRRVTAERALADLIERAKTLAHLGHHVWKVRRLAVFGSFLDHKADDVGDVDVIVELGTKLPDWSAHLQAEDSYRQREREHGRVFRSFIDELLSPRTDPLRFLKGRSSVVSLHDPADEAGLEGARFEIVYEDPTAHMPKGSKRGANSAED